jgi:hypothetical protein
LFKTVEEGYNIYRRNKGILQVASFRQGVGFPPVHSPLYVSLLTLKIIINKKLLEFIA